MNHGERGAHPCVAKAIVDVVKGVRREVHRGTVENEEVAVNKDTVVQGLEHGIAESFSSVGLRDGVSGKRELGAEEVREEGDVQVRFEPMSTHDELALADRAHNLGRGKIWQNAESEEISSKRRATRTRDEGKGRGQAT